MMTCRVLAGFMAIDQSGQKFGWIYDDQETFCHSSICPEMWPIVHFFNLKTKKNPIFLGQP